MKLVVITINIIMIAIVILSGYIYPSIEEWVYPAVGVLVFHMIFELIIASLDIMDAAKISIWVFQGLSSLLAPAVLMLYKLGYGDWWIIITFCGIGFMVVSTLIVSLAFKVGGVADTIPRPPTNSNTLI